jgi:electron transport complex protein RnfD
MNSEVKDTRNTRKFIVSPSPHFKAPFSVRKVMFVVTIALLPALGGAIYFFGLRSLWLVLIAVATAIGAEFLMNLAFKRPLDSCLDGSAIITGMLLAYNLPPTAPLWMAAVGSAFAIIIVKAMFGGLGHNFMNPALAGRAFLMASWPGKMTSGWILREGLGTTSGINVDAFSGATPLGVVQKIKGVGDVAIAEALNSPETLKALFFGRVGGVLGETSALLLLIPAVILILMRVIDWRIPAAYIGTVFLGALLAWVFKGTPVTPWFHLMSGGLMLGALFMATDYSTTPVTPAGQWIFGVGCGVLTILIRLWGGYPEGVSYSILLMNVATPLIDRYTRPRILGQQKKKKERK